MRTCKCHGLPMVANGADSWACPVARRASQRRYFHTPKGRETHDRYKNSAKGRSTTADKNQRRLFAGGMYLGLCGFTKAEREEMISGSSD